MSTAPKPTPTPTHTVTRAERLATALRADLESNDPTVEKAADGYDVKLTFDSEGLKGRMAKILVGRELTKEQLAEWTLLRVFQAAKAAVPGSPVHVVGYMPTVDKYGNPGKTAAVDTHLDAQTIQKINYDAIQIGQLWNLLPQDSKIEPQLLAE